MSEDFVLDEFINEEESKKNDEKIVQEKLPKIQPKKSRNDFKTKECNVIAYNKITNTLDINFDGYGIRIKDVADFTGDTVTIKYKGEIGKSNFEYKL